MSKPFQPAFVDSAWITTPSQASPIAKPIYDKRPPARRPARRNLNSDVKVTSRDGKVTWLSRTNNRPSYAPPTQAHVSARMALPSIHAEDQ